MSPVDAAFLVLLAKFGVETVIELIGAWKQSGEPTDEEIRALKITKKPEEYFDQ